METTQPNEVETPVVTQPPTTPVPTKKSPKMLRLIIFGIVMIFLGLGAGFLFFGGKTTPSEPAPQITPTLGQAILPTITLLLKPEVSEVSENVKAYKNAPWQFSLAHNPAWITQECTNEGSFILFLATNDDALGKCQSEFGGQMSVYIAKGDSANDHTLEPSSYAEIKTDEVTVDSVKGKRMSGTGTNADASPANNKGDKVVEYVFFTNEKTYSFRYVQKPEGSLSQDILADFDAMIQKHLTFN